MAADRWVAVGLANPESEYGGTRHNIGADAVRVLAARLGCSLGANKRVRCATAEVTDRGEKLVLAVPLSYMNESGGPVQALMSWFKVPTEHLIVLHDEIDLPTGVIRVKFGGGTAGHNGLRDVSRRLGTRDFFRVRIGVGRPPGRQDAADYVLRRFTTAEREVIDVAIEEAADAVVGIVHDGLEVTQNRIHARS